MSFVFYFLEKPRRTEGGAEEAYWARSLRKPRNEPFGRNTSGQRPVCQHYRYENLDRQNPSIIVSQPNGVDFRGILTHRFLEFQNQIKLL
jgi:hypothetical protein